MHRPSRRAPLGCWQIHYDHALRSQCREQFTGFALGAELLRTTDGGAVWENITEALPVSPEVSSIRQMYAEAPANIWLVNQSGQVFFSDNAGNDWTILAEIDNGIYRKFLRTNPGTLRLLSSNGLIWRSDDDGARPLCSIVPQRLKRLLLLLHKKGS